MLLPYFTMHKMFPSAQENMLMVIAKDGKLAAGHRRDARGAAAGAAA